MCVLHPVVNVCHVTGRGLTEGSEHTKDVSLRYESAHLERKVLQNHLYISCYSSDAACKSRVLLGLASQLLLELWPGLMVSLLEFQ